MGTRPILQVLKMFQVFFPVPVQVQCERFLLKPYNPFFQVLVPDQASVNTPSELPCCTVILGRKKNKLCSVEYQLKAPTPDFGQKPNIWQDFFARNCVNMNEIGPRGEACVPSAPWIRQLTKKRNQHKQEDLSVECQPTDFSGKS